MGLSKTEEFTKEQNEIAAIAKVLGHPARIAILQYLSEKKACVCGDIVEELPLSQSTVSQHLKELKKVGVIIGEIEGPTVCYCIDAKTISKANKLLGNLLQSVKDNCC
ncbi:MAG: winged helix-turn-helix transcriptional regulator [Flammeovirgaceae bacterium]|nr:winged helix-turn-helix transcriptional regulator [Flammeovirgaceae bacterium]